MCSSRFFFILKHFYGLFDEISRKKPQGMLEISKTGKLIILGIALPTTALLLYWLLKDQEEDEDFVKPKSKVATSRQTVIEVKIPRKAVGTIIGRQGQNIKELQEQSGARINFNDDRKIEAEERTLVIRGTPECAQSAECLVKKVLADMPVIVTEEIYVPATALGRIIGRNGDSVRQISRSSNTKVFIDKTRDDYRDKPRQVAITGTKENIEIAKSLIIEKVEEDEKYRASVAVSASNRETRKNPKESKHFTSGDNPGAANGEGLVSSRGESWDSHQPANQEECLQVAMTTWPKNRDYVEVYISAVENPSHFWVQIVSSISIQLDRMMEKMTAHYSSGNVPSLKLANLKVGDLVAAPFEHDSSWYRVRVMGIDGETLDLYYVDFGDSGYQHYSRVRSLWKEYLELPIQGVECCLANVKPKDGEWSEEGIEKFEDWTYCAKWKVIMAHAESTGDGDASSNQMPQLTLIDTNSDQDFNINHELVLHGYAEWTGPSQSVT